LPWSPVRLRCNAACSTAERLAFRQVNKATGNRLRQQLVDEETGAPVAAQDRGRGYEVASRSVAEDKKLAALRRGSGPGAQTGMSVMAQRSATPQSISCSVISVSSRPGNHPSASRTLAP
jgi:Ku70/Ku80 beta-barrel domain